MTAPVVYLVVLGVCVVGAAVAGLARCPAVAGFLVVAAVFAGLASVLTSAILAVAS